MGRGLGDAIGLGDGVGRGVAVGVAVAVGVGVGVGVPPPPEGAWIATIIGEPVLKNPTVALTDCGGWLASNRKLYSVPKRIAFAFWVVAKVSVLQVIEPTLWSTAHGVLLYPWLLNVPSLGHPGSCGGAWNPMPLMFAPPTGTLKD